MMFYSCAVVCNIPLGRNTTNTQVEKKVQDSIPNLQLEHLLSGEDN